MEPIGREGFTICRCEVATSSAILALAARGLPEEERISRCQTILELAAAGRTGDIVLIAARREEKLLGAVLAQVLGGRSALAWPPQMAETAGADSGAMAAAMREELFRILRERGTDVVQMLLVPGQAADRSVLQEWGFVRTANLLYLATGADRFPETEPRLPFVLESFENSQVQRWQAIVDRTYQGTLDCPGMDGMRKTADVLAGYQAVGEFHPELWRIARFKGSDIGCLLVALHPEVKHAELVYVGLVPEARGNGFGFALTRYAQWLAREAECEQLVLAVDAANSPAIRMYCEAGFAQWSEREVWLRSLG